MVGKSLDVEFKVEFKEFQKRLSLAGFNDEAQMIGMLRFGITVGLHGELEQLLKLFCEMYIKGLASSEKDKAMAMFKRLLNGDI